MKQQTISYLKYIICPVLCLVLIQACSGPEEKKDAAVSGGIVLTAKQMSMAGIKTDTLAPYALSAVVQVKGMIDVPPQNLVSVSAPMGGFLVRTDLLPGMHLNRGDVLAVMEDQQYIQLQQDFLTSRARNASLQKEFERQKELNRTGAGSDRNLELAETAFAENRILIRALSEKLRLIGIDPGRLTEDNLSKSIVIRSPISGYVSRVRVNTGKYVNASEVLFDLVNPEDIHLNMTVYEKDLPLIAMGNTVKAYNLSDPDKSYKCHIILIGRDVSPEGRVEVHCHFDDYDRNLIPGMYMNAEIQTETAVRPSLPESAIVLHDGKEYVFAETAERTFEMFRVRPGRRQGGRAEITDSILQGRKVVVSGAYDLLMMSVNKEEE